MYLLANLYTATPLFRDAICACLNELNVINNSYIYQWAKDCLEY